VDRLISAKEKSGQTLGHSLSCTPVILCVTLWLCWCAIMCCPGKTFSQISAEIGLTNVQTAALFFNQVMSVTQFWYVSLQSAT
jgi:hypothetical protein